MGFDDNKKQKVCEILAVLKILFEESSQTHHLSNKRIIEKAEDEYGVRIERRRCSDIVNVLRDISDSGGYDSGILPFHLNTNGCKVYRDRFVLSDDDFDVIIEALKVFQIISSKDVNALQEKLASLMAYGHVDCKAAEMRRLDRKLDSFRKLLNQTRKKKQGAYVFNIDFDGLTHANFFCYPFFYRWELAYSRRLSGFLIDIILCDDDPYACLLIDVSKEYRALLILPISKVDFFKPKDDFGLKDTKLDPHFKYGNENHYEDAFEAIAKYKENHDDTVNYRFLIKYETDETLIVTGTHVKEGLRNYYPNQFDNLKFIDKEDGYTYVEFSSTKTRFDKFLLSNLSLLGIVGVVRPGWVKCLLSNYGKLLTDNNSERPEPKFSAEKPQEA